MSDLISVIEVVESVRLKEAKQRIPDELRKRGIVFFSDWVLWYYHVKWEGDYPCPLCKPHWKATYLGSKIRLLFPYLEIEDIDTIKPMVHPNCLMKGTLIHTDKGMVPIEQVELGDLVLTHKGRYRPVVQLHRNLYEGEMYQIGNSWVTGNHPVLTTKGWMDANALNSFDDKLVQISPKRRESNEFPTVFSEELFFSSILFNLSRSGMPITTVDFDSEFSFGNSEIYVKPVNSIQRDNVDIGFLKGFEEELFEKRQFSLCLNPFCSVNQVFSSSFTSSNSIVGGFDLMSSLLGSHLFPFNNIGFTHPSWFDSRFHQPVTDNGSRNPISFSEGVFGNQIYGVEFNNFFDGKGNVITSRHVTSTINNIDKQQYKGVVYNLSVLQDESYVIGKEAYVVHNCKCRLERR